MDGGMKQLLQVINSSHIDLVLHPRAAARFAIWSAAERHLPLDKVGLEDLKGALASCLCTGVPCDDARVERGAKPRIGIIGGMTGFRIATWMMQQGLEVEVFLRRIDVTRADEERGALTRLVDQLADEEVTAGLISMPWSPPGIAALRSTEQLSERACKALMGRRRPGTDSLARLTGKPRHAFAERGHKAAGRSVLSRLLEGRGA